MRVYIERTDGRSGGVAVDGRAHGFVDVTDVPCLAIVAGRPINPIDLQSAEEED